MNCSFHVFGPMGGQDEVAALESLSVFCRSQRCLVHAKANLEAVISVEALQTQVAEISLKNEKGSHAQVGQGTYDTSFYHFHDTYSALFTIPILLIRILILLCI